MSAKSISSEIQVIITWMIEIFIRMIHEQPIRRWILRGHGIVGNSQCLMKTLRTPTEGL